MCCVWLIYGITQPDRSYQNFKIFYLLPTQSICVFHKFLSAESDYFPIGYRLFVFITETTYVFLLRCKNLIFIYKPRSCNHKFRNRNFLEKFARKRQFWPKNSSSVNSNGNNMHFICRHIYIYGYFCC